MERASIEQFKQVTLRDEHIHRYEFALSISRGFVVDCACGIGYSSEILSKNKSIEYYLGIDPSESAIDYARRNFADERVSFEKGSLESNSCGIDSVDTFLMFETLEHTINPQLSIEKIHSALKPNGLLIGSVPSAEYEELCEQVYGANPFHLQRFTRERIFALLSEKFECVRLYSAEYMLGTLIQDIRIPMKNETEIMGGLHDKDEVVGSIIFLAGAKERVEQAVLMLGTANKFFPSISKAILDRDEVKPIREAFHQAEIAVRERDEAIIEQARLLEERWAIINLSEAMIRARDEAITAQARMLEERWKVMQSMETMIQQRDELIAVQAKQLLIKPDDHK
jgi:2-polyprenyl-3-methyl-5-hydroxy-6-metoxy-1,4-benzoquinol methylase